MNNLYVLIGAIIWLIGAFTVVTWFERNWDKKMEDDMTVGDIVDQLGGRWWKIWIASLCGWPSFWLGHFVLWYLEKHKNAKGT